MVKLSIKECKELLMNYLSNNSNDDKRGEKEVLYRYKHSVYVKDLAEKIIKDNPDLFDNKEMNTEFLKACVLHDIYKFKGENHAHEAGILLMEMGFSFEIAASVMMHSDKHLPIENTTTISKYALLLQDVDILSKYNLNILKIYFSDPKELANRVYDLLVRLETTKFYFEDSEDMGKKMAKKMIESFSKEKSMKKEYSSKLEKMKKYLKKKK